MDGVRFLTTLGVRFFCLTPTPEVQLNHFLHHVPKLGIHVETVKFLSKHLLKQFSCCAPHFPLIANCYKNVNSQTSFLLC